MLSQLSQNIIGILKIKKLIFQEEIGKEKTKHLQGFVMFKNQVDFSVVKEALPTAHIEKCKCVGASIKYCSKKDTRSGALHTFGISPAELSRVKLPPLSEEEIYNHLLELSHKDIDDDKDGFWQKHQMDF